VEAAIFRYRDSGHYQVHRYVVMPDHLHVILTPSESASLEKCAQLIKGRSSHEIRSRFPVWQPGFSEHLIRDSNDFESHIRYIDDNPVKAGLVTEPREYPHGAVAGKFRLDPWPVASGAEAHVQTGADTAGLKPRPSLASESTGLKPRPSVGQDRETAGLKSRCSVAGRGAWDS
jgi:putative transposase